MLTSKKKKIYNTLLFMYVVSNRINYVYINIKIIKIYKIKRIG